MARTVTPIKELKISVRISFAVSVDKIVTSVSETIHDILSETHVQIAALIEVRQWPYL